MNRMKGWLAGLLLVWAAWGFAQDSRLQYGGFAVQLGGGYGTLGAEAFLPFRLLGVPTSASLGVGYQKAVENYHNLNFLVGGRVYFLFDAFYLTGKVGPVLVLSPQYLGVGGTGSLALGFGPYPASAYEAGFTSYFTYTNGEFRIKWDILLGYTFLAGGFGDD